MQVDVVLVRKHKLHQTKGVRWSRLLSDRELACPEFLQNVVVHGAGGNHVPVLRDNFVVLTGDVSPESEEDDCKKERAKHSRDRRCGQ